MKYLLLRHSKQHDTSASRRNMIRFIHTADIHFGMENYGKIDPKTGIHTRFLDFEKALNFCIDSAINRTLIFFFFAGDAYKTHQSKPNTTKIIMQMFFTLIQARHSYRYCCWQSR